MNTKFIQAIACLSFFALFVGISPISYATTTTTDNGYNDPIIRSFGFTADLDGGNVAMTWNTYVPAGFSYYKVVRSSTNPEPVYPEDGYIKVSTNPDFTSYLDTDVPEGTVYYRICLIAYPDRYCSTTVTIQNGEVAPAELDPEPATDPVVLALTASMGSDGVQLDWTIDGESPKGFKIVVSNVNEEPTYPVMSGDYYYFLTDPAIRSHKDTKVTAGKTYYYRVCEYLGGVCGIYSNAVSVDVPSDYVKSDGTIQEPTVVAIVPIKAVYTITKAETEFVDSETHQYSIAIDYLRVKAIVSGYDDGTFKPDNQINRAEFMKIVMGAKYASDLSAGVEGDCFYDVKMDWYAPYVCLAKTKNIVKGYDDGNFRPSQSISFVEAAKILSEVYGLDVTDGGQWYEGYVKALQSDNYIPSTIGQLDKPITRGEMAELIWRIKEQIKDESAATLIFESSSVNTSTPEGWATYYGDGYTVSHPNWYQAEKWGWDLLTDEKDFIDNINVPNYMAVDSYISLYTVGGSDLNTSVWFAHPFVSSQELTINGIPALKRHYRAPRGTVVNDRTTGENENITVYTYRLDGKVAVLQYFNAFGTDNYNVEKFYEIAETFLSN